MSSETYYVCVREASFHQFIISKLPPKAKKRKTKGDFHEHTENCDEEREGFTLQSLAIGTCFASLWLRIMLYCNSSLEALHETVLFEAVAK
jgi:hypothetical protein